MMDRYDTPWKRQDQVTFAAQEVIDNLASMAPLRIEPLRSLSAAARHQALVRARTCYDHLAGALGVAITEAMTARGLLDAEQELTLTAKGTTWLASLGIVLPVTTRRPTARSCLDWTERRPHLAGASGAALCRHAFDAGWVVRTGTSRAVAVTDIGQRALHEQLSLDDAAFGNRASKAG